MRRALLSLIVIGTIAVPAAALAAETIDWSATAPASGVVVDGAVRIEGRGSHPLIIIPNPGIGGDKYAIIGTVRYQDVAGAGYLEMWSYFADGSAYFSRTLASQGPSAAMTGNSSGRDFVLPFFLNGAAGPERVEFNVVLPESGQVWVGPLTLEGFGRSTAWWGERQAGIVGAVLGVFAGLLGTAIGVLNGSRRLPRAVEGLLIGGVALGVLLLVGGGVAMVASQPWHVSYPLLLTGLIVTLVCALVLPRVRQTSEVDELRRMRALDA